MKINKCYVPSLMTREDTRYPAQHQSAIALALMLQENLVIRQQEKTIDLTQKSRQEKIRL